MERRIKNTANKLIDLTGQKFGKLTVIGRAEDKVLPSGRKVVNWKCICDCQLNNENPQYTYVRGTHLTSGDVKSCGCLAKELSSKRECIDIIGNKYGMLTVV